MRVDQEQRKHLFSYHKSLIENYVDFQFEIISSKEFEANMDPEFKYTPNGKNSELMRMNYGMVH